MPASLTKSSLNDIQAVIARHWGFRTLRPLQHEAMRAVLDDRDSLVVLPTGGGKSLCYQAPAVLRGDTTVVISPLISLMKDQVDALQASGVPAIQIDSSQTPTERSAYEEDVLQGAVRLLFVSPERLVLTDFYRLLQQINVRTFAIDEAHCISHWGHDFRPEYRQLSRLRELFPGASIHAYTATATERVRRDIVEQLKLKNPEILVGNFDRPNLTYRVVPRFDLMRQVQEVLDRHRGEAGIVYCIRRLDVDALAADLRQKGYNVRAYHAGLPPEERKAAQDAFAQEQCDVVVATIAFGMGIDRSNVRFVLHTGMPKSVEHYQQETGRAGRDGLEAECVLLHSGGDFMTWKYIIEKSASDPNVDPGFLPSALKHLNDMSRYCTNALCRHRALVQYFGQAYPASSCAACDICLGDREVVPDSLVLAQKILSCVARVKEKFGIKHVAQVLQGRATPNIVKYAHDQLSTFGLLKEARADVIADWIRQLIGQEVLVQTSDEYPVLKLNDASWAVMKKQHAVKLLQPAQRPGRADDASLPLMKSKAETASWEGVDEELFEALRELRKNLAQERQVPPYVIFSDATLRELARVRPSSLERMRLIYGIGDAKLRDFGARFFDVIAHHCGRRQLTSDNPAASARPREEPRKASIRLNPQRQLAFDLFRRGAAIEDVMRQTGRSRSTIMGYLAQFIREERSVSIAAWVSEEIYQRVVAAVRQVGTDRLKPIFLALGEQVPYDQIQLVVAHLAAGNTAPR
ncbi:MAG TPA: DNA helicase RecQ [Gemmataceae bacterium]|nr:DNA helicase RecQ [Gemmataceae bacterium]